MSIPLVVGVLETCKKGSLMLRKEWFYLPDYQSGIIVVAGKQQRSFAYTYANWREVPSLPREMEYREPDFVSRSGSQYWYTNSGVYRKSDHWGRRIGTCEWYIDGCSYDELVSIIGYCRWDDFVDLERMSMRRDRAAMRRRYAFDYDDENTDYDAWSRNRRRLYQPYELESYLGDYIDDYDLDAIVNDATEIDYLTNDRYWIDDIDLAEIVDRHMRRRANRRRAMRKRAESYIDLIIDGDFGEAIVWDDADDYYIEIWRGNDLLETISGFVSEWEAINYVAENYDYIDPNEEH